MDENLNILKIHRFCGTETFKVTVATWMLLEADTDDEKPILSIDLYSDEPIKQFEDSEHGSHISWTIMVPLDSNDILLLKKNDILRVPNSDEDYYDDNNLFYYFEHNEILDQQVEIKEIDDQNRFLIKVKGKTQDVVFWKNPDAIVEVDVWCEKFDEKNPKHLV